MDNLLYGLIPIGIYYLAGLMFYGATAMCWKKREEGYTYINDTIRLEELQNNYILVLVPNQYYDNPLHRGILGRCKNGVHEQMP